MKVGGRRAVTIPPTPRLGPDAGDRPRHRRRPPRRRADLTLTLPAVSVDGSTSQVEAEVEHLRRVGELADGDVVDAGLADLAGDLEGQPAAGLEHDRPAGVVADRDGGAHLVEVEVVEQHGVGAGVDGDAQPVERVDLDLDRDRRLAARARRRTPRRRRRRRARGCP